MVPNFIELQDYMLPCINKKIFGIDCLGCGLQRSILLLLKGDYIEAFYMYPAVYTLIVLLAFVIVNYRKKFKNSKKIITTLVILNSIIIVTSYVIKMNHLIN